MNALSNPVLRLRFPIWRSRVLLLILLSWMLGLGARAVYLQGLNNDFLQQKGESRYSRVVEIGAHRGRIMDRHGETLAISTASSSSTFPAFSCSGNTAGSIRPLKSPRMDWG